ncbi:arsenite methyltransferase [Desulfatitalea tepidiphila]|uniref:arsenite methyltransferase n=1 Tax=Desulfatitalea tepidiphila TaxID=1185843 RepID=UPI0006B46B2C|nr:arsenite methyltransferase [Desulfatitalea tepidiphila]
MSAKYEDEQRIMVRERYGKIAGGSCGCPPTATMSCCCSSGAILDSVNQVMGYTQEQLGAVVEGANLGLGCGNPTAIGKLKPGETVLDLGSGGGFDCFLAARQVGETGRVIGVDMTPEMLARARENAGKMGAANVEFRLGEIEHLPVADNSVDVIISNCVINLAPDKRKVFAEALRVLKPGGRIAVSDVVAIAEMPEHMRQQAALLTGCIAGAEHIDRLRDILYEVGFLEVRIETKSYSKELVSGWFPGSGAENVVASADIKAMKPLLSFDLALPGEGADGASDG